MYTPGRFAETDTAAIEAMLERAPLGLLITSGPDGPFGTHMPFLPDLAAGKLAGHIARANPQPMADDASALVVFQGPNAYVSPGWYPTKTRDGRAVPTWNYEVVHVYGRLSWRDDDDWKREHLGRLSDRFEGAFEHPWRLQDAPEDYVRAMFRGIVGVEVAVERIEAKRKLSQNQPAENFQGALEGLTAAGDPGSLAIAALMRDLDSQ
jgi:transcriptional regulator